MKRTRPRSRSRSSFIDYIITNAAAYGLTGSVGSSIRRYYEDAHTSLRPPGPTGSHLATRDATGLLISDIRSFYRPLR